MHLCSTQQRINKFLVANIISYIYGKRRSDLAIVQKSLKLVCFCITILGSYR